MSKPAIFCLALLAALVTGCPQNQYVVELTPRGDGVKRQLTFFREEGTDTNGVPKYQDFPEAQLAAIKAFYPVGGVKADGKRYVARGQFTGVMPGDVGGAGSWTHLTTTLGHSVIYAERFRGNDDFATTSAERLKAVDQLTDLVIGWSRQELGREPQYETLRSFLDVDFRRDLKNLSLYYWVGGMAGNFDPKAEEEFVVRFGQYLYERGYVKLGQLPEWFVAVSQDDAQGVNALIQRLVADKMGLSATAPLPASFAFLADETAAEASFEKSVGASDLYRARLKDWETERNKNPDAKEPNPSEFVGELIGVALQWNLGGTDEHLTVKLTLPSAPLHTNGKWNAEQQQILWESALDEEVNSPRLPTFCYATWSVPDASFQREHFGRVVLEGESLLCFAFGGRG